MSRRTAVILTTLALIGLVVYGAFLAYRHFFTFYMSGTSPSTSSVSYLSPYIDVHFSQDITTDFNDFYIVSEENIVTGTEEKGSSLRILLTGMSIDETYTLTIPFIENKDGDRLENIDITFRAENIAFDRLSKEHQDYILAKQDEQPKTLTDPILDHLPHSTLNYEMRAVVTADKHGREKLILEAELMLSAADVRIDEAGAVSQYKKDVVEYIRSLKLDPADYTIEYVITKPTI